ncbi:hypothetical protein D3C80_1911740 [compost metagenome]
MAPVMYRKKIDTDISTTAGTTLLTVPARATQMAAASRLVTSTILRDSNSLPVILKILSEI